MKFSTILFAIMFASLSKAKPSTVYHVGNLAHVVPISYRHLPLGLIPIKRCFENNKLTICPSSQDLQTHPPLLSKSHQNQPIVDLSDIVNGQRIRDANQEYVNYKTLGRLTTSRVHPVKNIYLQLDTPNMKSILNYLSKSMPVESSYEVRESTEKPAKAEEVKTSSEIVQFMENLYNETETVETTTEEIDVKNTLSEKYDAVETSLENIESTPTSSNYNISTTANNVTLIDQNMVNESLYFALDQFELKLYVTNFDKFLALTPGSKGDSGMSFVQSALFLGMTLMAFSTEADLDTKNEIDRNFGWNVSDLEKIRLIEQVMSSLPNSSEELKFRWSSRLVLRSGRQLSQEFTSGAAAALQLKIKNFKETQTPVAMAQVLNRMIEEDSDGAIRDTFEEEDLSKNEEAVLITTLYLRARWRSAPTLLNGTWLFRDTGNASSRSIRMIRINDIVKYVDLPEWEAEAIEIPYLTKGLSLLMLVPRGNSLRSLVEHVTGTNLTSITERLQNMRIAVALPLYTLRMTLLLPNKLQAVYIIPVQPANPALDCNWNNVNRHWNALIMGISRLVNVSEAEGGSLRISQAVQRIMFWAEAGRNAYKDDGLEWDAPPEMNITVDRPYMFCVRWQNTNLMLGNFVL